METTTKPSVEDMNRVIQAFMGLPIYREQKNFSDENYRMVSSLLQWHSDWNLLMGVVEKIEGIYFKKHGYFGVYISSNSCVIQGTKFNSGKREGIYYSNMYGVTKIHATWLNVYYFIDWYNTRFEKWLKVFKHRQQQERAFKDIEINEKAIRHLFNQGKSQIQVLNDLRTSNQLTK